MGLDLYHFIPSDNNVVEYFTIEELSAYPDYIERHNQFIVEKDFVEFGKEHVICFDSIGYQRKGMNRNFYTDFENDKLHFDLKDVIKAYGYLEADHINTLDQLQENFKRNFIDNFEEGKSIFFAGW